MSDFLYFVSISLVSLSMCPTNGVSAHFVTAPLRGMLSQNFWMQFTPFIICSNHGGLLKPTGQVIGHPRNPISAKKSFRSQNKQYFWFHVICHVGMHADFWERHSSHNNYGCGLWMGIINWWRLHLGNKLFIL